MTPTVKLKTRVHRLREALEQIKARTLGEEKLMKAYLPDDVRELASNALKLDEEFQHEK